MRMVWNLPPDRPTDWTNDSTDSYTEMGLTFYITSTNELIKHQLLSMLQPYTTHMWSEKDTMCVLSWALRQPPTDVRCAWSSLSVCVCVPAAAHGQTLSQYSGSIHIFILSHILYVFVRIGFFSFTSFAVSFGFYYYQAGYIIRSNGQTFCRPLSSKILAHFFFSSLALSLVSAEWISRTHTRENERFEAILIRHFVWLDEVYSVRPEIDIASARLTFSFYVFRTHVHEYELEKYIFSPNEISVFARMCPPRCCAMMRHESGYTSSFFIQRER